MNFLNIRQTVNWEKYLNTLNWKSFRLSNGDLVTYYPTMIGGLGKLQKPKLLSSEILNELENKCREYKLFLLKIEPDIVQNTQDLESFGYLMNKNPLSPTKTAYIDLQNNEEELWNNISHSGKYGINRGSKEGTKVEFVYNPSIAEVTKFYNDIYLYTANTKNFISISLLEFLSLYESFMPNIYISLIYDKNNVLCGGKFYLVNDDVVFYLLGGTTKKGGENKSGFVQMWESIKYFKSQGFTIMDLDGYFDERFVHLTKDWKGFSEFKSKFGCNIKEYPYPYVKSFNGVINATLKPVLQVV